MASFAEIHKNTLCTTYNSTLSLLKEEILPCDEENSFNIEYRKYVENKIVYECLLDCINDLDLEVGTKLEEIISDVNFKQYMKLENQSLLGITLERRELTYQEANQLKTVLQKKILEKKIKLFKEFKKITSRDLDQAIKEPKPTAISSYDSSLSQKDQNVIEYKEKLVREQELFMKNVTKRNQLLEEMLELRLKKVPEMCNKTNRFCKVLIESNFLKARMAEYKMKVDIFMEVPKAIEAYHELLKDIKQQQEDCELNIEKMKEMKMKYENVGGREYSEILKSYLMYKHSIDELNKMYALVK